METRTITINEPVLAKNEDIAAENRKRFHEKNIRVVNILSSPGAGKTALLERTLTELESRLRMAVIVGDLATDNDARRMRKTSAPVVQVVTDGICHLEAQMVAQAAATFDLNAIDLLIIENVGNLVCPASFDLGEDARVVLLSVTEGEDKPLKYPTVFKRADVVLVTKTDIAGAVGFDREAALENIRRVAPQAAIFELSSRSGEGMENWYRYLLTS